MSDTALARAISRVGGPTKLAGMLDITSQAISQWERCPADRCIAVEAATGGEVTRYELRPDIFGSPPASGSADDRAA